MRQLGDTLVWMVLVLAVVAVVYFTPRVADYFSDRETHRLRELGYQAAPDWSKVHYPPYFRP